jgi:hypothetical protein
MTCRLRAVEVIKVNSECTPSEFQDFIQKWNVDNPEKANDESFMPLFSPFIDRCALEKNETSDELTVVMLISTDQWPSRQEVADITFFVNSLKDNYEALEVKMMFEVVWA